MMLIHGISLHFAFAVTVPGVRILQLCSLSFHFYLWLLKFQISANLHFCLRDTGKYPTSATVSEP